MSQDEKRILDIKNGVASFIIHVPGAQEPTVIKRLSGIKREIIMIGRSDDPAALSDLSEITPDLPLRLPQPVAHVFSTNQPNKAIIVVGPRNVLHNEEIVESYAAKPMNQIQARGPRFILSLDTMNELFVVTGMPGTGRRKAVTEMMRRVEKMAGPDQLRIIRTATTRQPRSVTDNLYYDFMSEEEFSAKRAAGELIQVASYGKTSYGIDRAEALHILSDSSGICILVDSDVKDLQRLGVPVSLMVTGVPAGLVLPQAPVLTGKN